jgi:hypothetical protein
MAFGGIIQGYMTRAEKIQVLNELLLNHKQGLAIGEEYTIARYDFMVAEGLIQFTNEQKQAIFEQAKEQYLYELNNLEHTGSVVEGHTAQKAIHSIEENLFTDKQLNYLYDKCKVIGLMRYLDSVDKLNFK